MSDTYRVRGNFFFVLARRSARRERFFFTCSLARASTRTFACRGDGRAGNQRGKKFGSGGISLKDEIAGKEGTAVERQS